MSAATRVETLSMGGEGVVGGAVVVEWVLVVAVVAVVAVGAGVGAEGTGGMTCLS